MSQWIYCHRVNAPAESIPARSHSELHDRLEALLVSHEREGRQVRNVLRDGHPNWDVVDASGAVLATYKIVLGSLQPRTAPAAQSQPLAS